MKKAEQLSLLACLFSTAAGIFPVLTFFCLNGMMNRNVIFSGVFILNALAAVLNRLTPDKYSKILPKAYTAVLAVTAFFISQDAPVFYKLVISAVVLILSVFMQKKNELTITSIYAFALITFMDVLFSFITSYTFPQIDITIHIFFYVVYVVFFAVMTALRSRTAFFKKKPTKVNKKIIAAAAISICGVALLSIPLSVAASDGVTALLKLLFGGVGGGNTNRPVQAQADKSFSPDNLGVTQGGPLARYIILAVCAIFVLFMIIFLHREIADFFSNLPDRLRRKRKHEHEIVSQHDEYTDFVSIMHENISFSATRKKLWKKRLREYRRMDWSVKKMRAGLELAQNGLMLSGTQIKESDTVLDIEDKLPEKVVPYWHKAAICYMNCRYNGALPQKEDEKDFEALIKIINKIC